MPPVISLVIFLAVLLYARHIDTERRALRAQMRHDALSKRLAAVEDALPQVEAQYGSNSVSARYLRATHYLTRLQLRDLTPRLPTGRPAIGGTR